MSVPRFLADEDLRYSIVVSHDVTSMRPAAEQQIAAGLGMSGLFLAAQSKATSEIAESLLLIWQASQAEEWRDRIIYLPI